MTLESSSAFLWHARVCNIRHLGGGESSLAAGKQQIPRFARNDKICRNDKVHAALSDRRGLWRQWWRLVRRNLWRGGRGRWGVEHGAQRRIAGGKEVHGIRGKEHDRGHGNQRDNKNKNDQQCASGDYGQRDRGEC